MTKANLAKELGVSKARISQYVKNGLPVAADGSVDHDTALAWVQANVVRALGGHGDGRRSAEPIASMLPLQAPASKKPTRADAERELAELKSERLRLALDRERGEVILAAEAEQVIAENIEAAKNELLLMPERLAQRLAASKDSVEVRNILLHEVRQALERLERKLAA